MNTYEIVDTDSWERKQHFQIFSQYEQPRYDVSFELDVTKFNQKRKEEGMPFTFAFMHVVATCANTIPEFQYRYEGAQVVRYYEPKISFAYLNHETELLKNVVVKMIKDRKEFSTYAREKALSQQEYFTGLMGNDIYQFSSIPWIHYTHISHTDSGRRNNAVPMFDWGMYSMKDGKLMLPFSVQVNHAFVDGIHIGKLAKAIQEELDSGM